MEFQVIETLNAKMRIHFPLFVVKNAEVQIMNSLNYDQSGAVIKTDWVYNNRFSFNAITVVQ